MTPQERALVLDSRMTHWYSAAHCEIESDGWYDSTGNIRAEPARAVLPTWVASGGTDGQPYALGAATNPAGRLYTASSNFPANADWSVAIVAQAGDSAQATVFGVVGSDGNGIAFQLRTSNLFRIMTLDAAMALTQRLSVAASSAAFHYALVTYNETTKLLSIYIDGTLAGSVTYDFTYGQSRFSLFGVRDMVDNLDANDFRSGKIAAVQVFAGDMSDTASRALVDAAIGSRYPSLV
ncbi:hypothetical protein P6U16_22205 (plasmid) [Rhizobium sp. 32-5/1]|uniref:LamG-like jellyroll fold domain-containing protein n=1 Tax=Rhizobium sp. 32-5/1 TaxID=3019602 RepID=UPI00240E75F8|nr:LamG-like jellyroll fold domain-containing protein [Rhizobium sp. 32-5/1]WEZ85757.1 hypothetical protein P6U16_22205 [Rhizobium sp. 32-5/1]